MAQKLTIQGKEFEFEHRDSSLDKRGTLKIKQTMRERFGGEFPFGSFAGSVAKASEVLDFIDSEIELAIAEERERIVKMIEKKGFRRHEDGDGSELWEDYKKRELEFYRAKNEIINLITKQ